MTTSPTKTDFLSRLREEIVSRYSWASDGLKLDRFMAMAEQTVTTDRNVVNIHGEAFTATWKALGLKGRPTYRSLRALG